MRKSVIPTPAWVVGGLLMALGIVCVLGALVVHHGRDSGRFAVVGLVCILLSGYSLLVGYVHGDAKRRGMRYVMWTWLALLVPNALGIILYFILREPLSNFCTGCGAAVRPGFAYCPQCGAGMAIACKKCNRVSQEGWTHCAYCGTPL
jgi:predicted RNA-binding Zn-ribbon protein involved in translation (DUF1610 family)